VTDTALVHVISLAGAIATLIASYTYTIVKLSTLLAHKTPVILPGLQILSRPPIHIMTAANASSQQTEYPGGKGRTLGAAVPTPPRNSARHALSRPSISPSNGQPSTEEQGCVLQAAVQALFVQPRKVYVEQRSFQQAHLSSRYSYRSGCCSTLFVRCEEEASACSVRRAPRVSICKYSFFRG